MPTAKVPYREIDINELIGEGVRLLKDSDLDLSHQDMKTKMVKAYKSMDRHIPVPYTQISSKETHKSQNKWIFVTALIATYGFLKNISPESPYLAEYFVGPKFNFTVTQVTQDIYPVSVYGSVLQTSVVLLITDILRYKPIIICGAAGFVLHKSLLVFGHTLLDMQLNQFFWATTKACSLAYKTYIYNKVDREHYQIVTAVIRIAPKAGTLFSAILAQVALSFFYCTIEDLNEISLVASVMALVCAMLLPSMKKSVYKKDNKTTDIETGTKASEKSYCHAFNLLLQDFKEAYTNPQVLKWCIWWIIATGGFQQVTDYYIQVLWSEINNGTQSKYNGGVEAINTIVSSLACYLIGSIQVDWRFRGELVIGICTLLKGMLLFCNSMTHSIVVSYIIYVTFSMLFDIMSVVTNAEVAKHLKNESFALIFGINTFLGLVWQAALTYVLTNKDTLALPIREQFVVVSCGFVLLGLGYSLRGIYKFFFCDKAAHLRMINEVTPICKPVKVKSQQPNMPNIAH